MGNFKYERIDTEPEEHLVDILASYGEFTPEVEPWARARAKRFYDRVAGPLMDLVTRAKTVKSMDLSRYRPEAAAEIRAAEIRGPRQAFLSAVRDELYEAKAAVQNMKSRILAETEPPRPTDTAEVLRAELRGQEIRSVLRPLEIPEVKKRVIERAKAGDLSYLHAIIQAPDELLPTESVTEIRRAIAFEREPLLASAEEDAETLYNTLRAKGGQLNATSLKIVGDAGLSDPVSEAEFFSVFEPRSQHEAGFVAERLEREKKAEIQRERRAEFEKKNPGVNIK